MSAIKSTIVDRSLSFSTLSLLMLTSTIILPGVWKGGLSADKFRWALPTCCRCLYIHYLLPPKQDFLHVHPKRPLFPRPPPLRAPTDRLWVGEQLFSEDVPVPVCKFEQLHILHRFLSWKVGCLLWTLQFLYERLCKDVYLPCHGVWLLSFPSSLCSYVFGPHVSAALIKNVDKLWFIEHNKHLKCLFFSSTDLISFDWI